MIVGNKIKKIIFLIKNNALLSGKHYYNNPKLLLLLEQNIAKLEIKLKREQWTWTKNF